MTKAGVVLAGVLLALSVLSPQASAAVRTVHLTSGGPKPASLTITSGDTVRFVNDDTVPHQVRSQGAWQYDSGPIPPGQTSSATPRLTAPGTYRYSDVRGIVVLPQSFAGSLTVPAPKPTGSATPQPTRSPTPTTTPTPRPTRTPTASPAPAVTPSPTPVRTPSPSPTRSAVPLPTPSQLTPSPAPEVRYGDPQALVQASPHRYGLPALLAGVAIAGVLSLLVRYLLAQPEGRRTGTS